MWEASNDTVSNYNPNSGDEPWIIKRETNANSVSTPGRVIYEDSNQENKIDIEKLAEENSIGSIQLRPGDVFYYDLKDGADVDHVGIYMGEGIFIETATKDYDLQILGPDTDYGINQDRYNTRLLNVVGVKRYF